jgi:hypothetical protein
MKSGVCNVSPGAVVKIIDTGRVVVQSKAGPTVHFDASKTASLFVDTAGTQPVAINGDIVRRWNSVGSLAGMYLTRTSPDNLMTYKAPTSNSRPTVSMVMGQGQFSISKPLPTAPSSGASMVVVMRLPQNTNSGQAFWTTRVFNGGTHWPYNHQMLEHWGFNGQTSGLLTGKYQYGTIMLYAVVADPVTGQTKMYVNNPTIPLAQGVYRSLDIESAARCQDWRVLYRIIGGAPPTGRGHV